MAGGGDLVTCGAIFSCRMEWRCSWHLTGGGQGCHSMPHRAQGRPPPPSTEEAGCLSVLGTQCLVGEDTTRDEAMGVGWARLTLRPGDRKGLK